MTRVTKLEIIKYLIDKHRIESSSIQFKPSARTNIHVVRAGRKEVLVDMRSPAWKHNIDLQLIGAENG